MAIFISTKTYGPEAGFSVCYRQWKADTHCNKLHGYALGFHLEFQCDEDDSQQAKEADAAGRR